VGKKEKTFQVKEAAGHLERPSLNNKRIAHAGPKSQRLLETTAPLKAVAKKEVHALRTVS